MPKAKAQPTRPTENRIWIELDKPFDKEHADKQCELANNLLKRLNGNEPGDSKFWWSEHEKRYCYGGNHGYTVLADRGQWFNLDFFGRPIES